MRSKGEALAPVSANISVMQTTEEDEERAQSGERSRGKRRTAREIATMFEQLKRRHIARKKEWLEEREELMRRVETAEESQRVLAEIKIILQNLREELRLEERIRIEMEEEHFAEKRRWEKERVELLKRIEESACESDRDGKDMTRMTEKLDAQSRRLSEFQTIILDLKKQLLEKENSFLREKRQLQFGFEKERSLWKKKEQTLTDKLSQSSASSTSPSHVGVDNIKDFINMEDHVGVRRKSSASSATEQSKYNNFQRTVDDALKQIEQISSDLNHIDAEKHKFDRAAATPSPRLQFHTTTTPPEQPPSPNAPWRTKRHSSASKHVTPEKTLSLDSKYNISSSSVLSDSPVDISICLPSINTVYSQTKRSPKPERKVRKINSQGNKFDIIVSSPDAPTPTGTLSERFFPFADQSISESSISRDFISDTSTNSKGLEAKSKKATQTNVPRRQRSPKLSRQRKLDFLEDSPAIKQPVHEIGELNRPRHVENKLVPNEDREPKQLGTSPRLPKLHQQLLFKKEPSLPRDKILAQKSFESESLASTDKGKTSDDEAGLLFTNTRNISKAYQKERNSKQTYTPSVGAKLGYVNDAKSTKEQYEKRRRNDSSANTYQLNYVPNTISQPQIDKKKDEIPPVVHPKPKVSIHKDQEGNIVRVSPAADRKSTSPESVQGNEKQCSIAERMGKAGRDWIRKKLSFKDRRPEDQHGSERSQGTPDQTKQRGKSKTRHRPSSLLRSKGSQRSLSTSEESSDAEQEERRRESFLRRTRKKGKGSEGYNSASPVRKPKKYTRSKTEASSRDMRNFLNKFKASQSNPNKPSVIKQFELKLLENEVKTLNEDNIETPHAWKSQNDASVSSGQQQIPRDGEGYLSGEEGDAELDPMSPIYGDRELFLQTIMDPEVTFQEKAKAAPKVKPKSYNRRSMTDFKSNAESQERVSESDKGRGRVAPDDKSNSTLEAGELCEKKGVSKLVNRFSTNLDDDVVLGVKKPIQNRPVKKSSFVKTIESEKSDNRSRENPRSHSLSSHQGQRHRKRLSATVRFDTDPIEEGLKIDTSKEDTENWDSHASWSDRMNAKPAPETRNHKSSLSTSSGYSVTQPHRVYAPPHKFDSLSSFWESERPPPDKEQDENPGRMKRLSEKMQRKADMLENALTKGPKKSRRYRRADTQPVFSGLHSSDSDTLSDTDDVLDVALPPFTKDLVKTNGENDSDLQEPRRMHRTIPPVTGKFSRPAKPGRLPSRWAR